MTQNDHNYYSLVEESLQLGGKVVDYATGEIIAPGAAASGREEAASSTGANLSTAHNWTRGKERVEFWRGASLIRVTHGKTTEKHGGGIRGKAGFSPASRRRLKNTLNKVKRAYLPIFVTLTYPEAFPDPETAKKHFINFCRRLEREFPKVGLVWKREFQERGATHFHLLVWGVSLGDLRSFVPLNWYKVAGDGDEKHLLWHLGKLGKGNKHCVQPVYSSGQVMAYASKYMSKVERAMEGVGRWWGVRGAENIPWGEMETVKLKGPKQVFQLMRLMRRYMRLRKSFQYSSLYMGCNADFWYDRLDRLLEG